MVLVFLLFKCIDRAKVKIMELMMLNALKWAVAFSVLSACSHPGPTDDLNEVTDFLKKVKLPYQPQYN